MENTRWEEDSIGGRKIPADVYYGVQTLRAVENFPISGHHLCPEFIESLAYIKKAAALANLRAGVLEQSIAKAIMQACDEILGGSFRDAFIVDPLQGGAGTSMNMNANEVIANRAIEILGGKKGDYSAVHPNDHVNFGQSTNDVIPSAGKITTIVLMERLEASMQKLFLTFLEKSTEFMHIIKMGRTQMQDAVPITLGQEFFAYGDAIRRGIDRLQRSKEEMLSLNMGGTAIGTGVNSDIAYFRNIVPIISSLTGFAFTQADDLIDATMNVDCFAGVSGAVKSCAVALSKIASDLRLLSSGPRTGFGEITLPAKQNGSSIMPGKINPVIPEIVNQVAFKVSGNDMTIAMAVEAGQLELNAFEPVIFECLFGSLKYLTAAVDTFRINCVEGIQANEAMCLEHLTESTGVVTALCPHIGYKAAAAITKESLATGKSIRELVLSKGLMTEPDLERVLNAEAMTSPGIAAKELLSRKEH